MTDPNTYSLLEDEYLAKLQPLTAKGWDVEVMPDNLEDFKKPFERPRITIFYKSSEFNPGTVSGLPDTFSTGPAVQEEFAEIEVIVRARALRGADGVHAVGFEVRKLLYGFTPTHFERAYLKSHGFVEAISEDGLWSYSFVFVTRSLVVEDYCEEFYTADGIGLNQITTNYENGGQTIIIMDFNLLKGSQLPVATEILPVDYIFVIQDGATKIIKWSDALTAIAANNEITGAQIKAKLEALADGNKLLPTAIEGYDPIVVSDTMADGESLALGSDIFIAEIILISATSQTVSIGTVDDGTDVIDSAELTANTPYSENVGLMKTTDINLFLTSTGDVTVIAVKFKNPNA